MRARGWKYPVSAVAALAVLAGFALPAAAQRNVTLFTMTDPTGDDAGSGDLIYPGRSDFERGDLDLLSLSAEMDKGGTWFTAHFANPIRDPKGQRGRIGPEMLDRVARNGFYTLNLDIYIDTDRKPGSGNTATVPGRGVQIDRADAWEKAVILTPRPEVARTMMMANARRVLEEQRRAQTGVVSNQDLANIEASVAGAVDDRYFFPTRVQVNRREIRFFVPDGFLGGKANPAWAYTAFVTGADVEPSQAALDLPFKNDRFSVLMLPAREGRPEDAFGINGDPAQPAVVDVLHGDGALQSRMLMDYDVVAGRLPRLTGVVPTGRNQTAWQPYKGPSTELAGAAAGGKPPAEPKPFQPTARDAAAALSGAPILPEPAADVPAAAPAPSTGLGMAPPAAGGDRRTVAQRLRELTELRQQNLISEEEYQDARRRILSGI
ncbi:glucodextranase DOMON-like domain-containing protein [Indioceanicola profundi]|uniref:glucodextranase DOMON-like domain-containing protein n=1 Tax=Indioceanicola profundi TaxID=2220096 RepID=UPI000E6A98FD|nr:glucodextranase DOMON-like domain-containing protein [Indioceanicola profundi]